MSLGKRLGILIVVTLAGTLATFVVAVAYYEGWFVPWESLGRPPEEAVQIVAVTNGLWVETALNHVYHYEGDRHCGDNCWVTSDYPQPDPPPFFPLDACGRFPSLARAVDTKATCQPWGPGSYLIVYAIREDGNVLVWEHGIGEGGSMIWAPILAVCYGAPISLLIAILIALSLREQRHDSEV